jgi:uncharacterized protein (DUF1330 family)
MTMAAYIIANIEITDPAPYEAYRSGVPATLAQYGGRYLARGGATLVLEGAFVPKRIVVIEFPSLDAAKSWHASPEYAPLKALRQRTSTGDLFAVDGV